MNRNPLEQLRELRNRRAAEQADQADLARFRIHDTQPLAPCPAPEHAQNAPSSGRNRLGIGIGLAAGALAGAALALSLPAMADTLNTQGNAARSPSSSSYAPSESDQTGDTALPRSPVEELAGGDPTLDDRSTGQAPLDPDSTNPAQLGTQPGELANCPAPPIPGSGSPRDPGPVGPAGPGTVPPGPLTHGAPHGAGPGVGHGPAHLSDRGPLQVPILPPGPDTGAPTPTRDGTPTGCPVLPFPPAGPLLEGPGLAGQPAADEPLAAR